MLWKGCICALFLYGLLVLLAPESYAQSSIHPEPNDSIKENFFPGQFTNNSSYPIAYVANRRNPDGSKGPSHTYVLAPGESTPSDVDVDGIIDAHVATDPHTGNYIPPTLGPNDTIYKMSNGVIATATDLPGGGVNIDWNGWRWSDLGTPTPASEFSGNPNEGIGPQNPPPIPFVAPPPELAPAPNDPQIAAAGQQWPTDPQGQFGLAAPPFPPEDSLASAETFEAVAVPELPVPAFYLMAIMLTSVLRWSKRVWSRLMGLFSLLALRQIRRNLTFSSVE